MTPPWCILDVAQVKTPADGCQSAGAAPPGRAGLPRGRDEAVAGQQQGAAHGGGAPQTTEVERGGRPRGPLPGGQLCRAGCAGMCAGAARKSWTGCWWTSGGPSARRWSTASLFATWPAGTGTSSENKRSDPGIFNFVKWLRVAPRWSRPRRGSTPPSPGGPDTTLVISQRRTGPWRRRPQSCSNWSRSST